MARLPTVKQLRYFAALDEHRHFGRAAEASFVSQSAFSVAIRELENLLGAQLVDRSNRRVAITALGKDVAHQARLCLHEIDSLVDLARGAQEPLTGRVRLGVIPTIAPFLLPHLFRPLRRSLPKLDLYLKEDRTMALYERMMAGDLDLILIALPYELRGVEVRSLFRENFLLACRRSSRLVDPQRYRIDRLPDESVLLLEEGHCLREHIISACRIRNPDKVSRFAASSVHTLLQMVDGDLGITFVPEMAAETPLFRGTRVRTYPVSGTGGREIALVWRKGSARQAEFAALGEFIREHRRPVARPAARASFG